MKHVENFIFGFIFILTENIVLNKFRIHVLAVKTTNNRTTNNDRKYIL